MTAPEPPSTSATLPPTPPVLLAWTSGGLPPGFASQVDAIGGVEQVTIVNGDLLDLAATFDATGRAVDTAPPGMRIPIDALAIDAAGYPAFVEERDREVLAALGPGEAVLGATSNQLRGLGVGGVLELSNGQRLTVVGVVADGSVGAAEVVVSASDAAAIGIDTPRFLLLTYAGARETIEPAIAGLVPEIPVRMRSPEETRFLRHADLVLPQALVKERFGEFAYAPGDDRFVTVDPAFTESHIANADVPILGEVTCHRAIIPELTSALRELESAGLASLLDPAGYQGCYAPSVIPGAGGLSRHSWGIALDVNFLPNPGGLASFADPRLIEILGRWGFRSGAEFLAIDPGHFEYVGSGPPAG